MTLNERLDRIFEVLKSELEADPHAALEKARESLYHARKSLDIETLQLTARLHTYDPLTNAFVPEKETQIASAYVTSSFVIVQMPAGNIYKLPRWENYDTQKRSWRHWPKEGRASKRKGFYIDFEIVKVIR